MAEDAEVRAFESAQQTVGHFGGFEAHVGVDAADDEVEFGEGVIGKVEGSLLENVALDAGEDANAEAVYG